MSVVVLIQKITDSELNSAREEYGDYIKIVVDVEKYILAAGGEWHADAEKILLEQGSLQKNLWGGGLDINSGQIDYISLINTRPSLNNSQEVSDPQIREKMNNVITKIFASYVE